MTKQNRVFAAGIGGLLLTLCGSVLAAESLDDRLAGLQALAKEGKFAEAASGARSLLAEVESQHGTDSIEVAYVLDDLTSSLENGGSARDPETLALAERAVVIKETVLGPNDAQLAGSLCRLARLRYYSGDARGAIPIFERALAIQEKHLGPESVAVGETLNDLAETHKDLGEYSTAKRLHERSLAIMEKKYGPDDRRLITHLNNLATMYDTLGEYSRAKSLRERALALATKHYGPDSPHAGPMLTNLGQLLDTLGDYAGAKPLLERALAIDEKRLDPDDPNLAADLMNLAATLENMGDHAGAARLLERSIRIMEKGGDRDHPVLAMSLANLALVRVSTGDYASAWPLFARTLEMEERSYGPDHPWVGDTLLNIAGARNSAGDYAQAKPLFERAIAIQTKSRGREHPWVAMCLNGLALATFRMGEPARAFEASLQAEEIGRETVRLTSRTLSEREALDYASHRPSGLDLAISIAVTSADASVHARAWDAVIRSRALVLDEMLSRHRLLGGSDPEIAALRERMISASGQVAFLLVHGASQSDPDSYLATLDDARRSKEHAEHALAERSLPFRQELAMERIGLSEVAKRLSPGSALVAYVLFDRTLPSAPRKETRPKSGSTKSKSESVPTPWYAAFVLRAGADVPGMFPLGTAKEIDSLVARWQDEAAHGALAWGRPAKEAETAYRAAGEALRRKVWDPVAAALGDAERTFVVQDGALNLLSIASLPVGSAEYLIERGPLLHHVSVERDLVPPELPTRHGDGLLAVGGPAFDATSLFAALAPPKGGTEPPAVRGAAPVEVAARIAPAAAEPYRGMRSSCGDFRSARFESLPAAERETDEIASVWEGVDVPIGDVTRLTGASASEAAFKRLAPGRRTLHLATHGFFLGEHCASALDSSRSVGGLTSVTESSPPSEGENPLLLSGLALAGANHRDAAVPDEEDGILTAEEITAMDLTGVDWAVLSACDTGRGEIKAGEGVFGLRRAFQVAGAGTLIMSLWSVQDEWARAWMKALYEGRLVRRLDTAQAVRDASLAVMTQRRKAGESTHPFYWAAFVAAGDWR